LLRGRAPEFKLLTRLALVCTGMALLLAVAHTCGIFRQTTVFTQIMLAYPLITLGCVLILLAALCPVTASIPILKNRALIYLGQISYGLYIFHELGLLLTRLALAPYMQTVRGFCAYWLLALALTIAMAAISYRWLEQPFLRLKRRFASVPSGAPA
ncbi:MAG: acyltransferase family protein, partial [Candidatus Acidiferrum sp.]